MFEDELDDRVYIIAISDGVDDNGEYELFKEKLAMKPNFKWDEVLIDEEDVVGSLEGVDVVFVLSGLFSKNRDFILRLVNGAKDLGKPIILIRPFGLEEVPLDLEKFADDVKGWNAACIVDSVLDFVLD